MKIPSISDESLSNWLSSTETVISSISSISLVICDCVNLSENIIFLLKCKR